MFTILMSRKLYFIASFHHPSPYFKSIDSQIGILQARKEISDSIHPSPYYKSTDSQTGILQARKEMPDSCVLKLSSICQITQQYLPHYLLFTLRI